MASVACVVVTHSMASTASSSTDTSVSRAKVPYRAGTRVTPKICWGWENMDR